MYDHIFDPEEFHPVPKAGKTPMRASFRPLSP
jgi:hypothetical protein